MEREAMNRVDFYQPVSHSDIILRWVVLSLSRLPTGSSEFWSPCPYAGTTTGQDLNLSLDRVTASRNFTNKLWNAAKFVLLNLEDVSEDEWAELGSADFSHANSLTNLPLPETWILSILHEVCL